MLKLLGLAILAVSALMACSSTSWAGIQSDGSRSTIVGHYDSLESCQATMKNAGGACGKGCRDYGNGLIADCQPLIPIPKE